MSEFASRIFQEEFSADSVKHREKIYKKCSGKKRYGRAVLDENEMSIRNQELAFPHEEECQSHHDHGRQEEGISNHGGLLLEGLVFAEVGDGESEWVDRDHGIGNL